MHHQWLQSCTLENTVSRPVMSDWVLVLVTHLFFILFPLHGLAVSAGIVISQVYGGGGNSGASLKNDFIELFNRGATTVNVTGWSVQYSSSTGTSWQVTGLSGSIAPGQYYLVQESAGSGGTTNLPSPDAVGNIALSSSSGKVALVNDASALNGSCPAGSTIVDFVGYGSANCSEGNPTPPLNATTAALRASNGCVDTDNNAADFSIGPPIPRNRAAGPNLCSGPTNPSGVSEANPASVVAGGSTLLTVRVTPGANPPSTGIAVTGNLLSIGGSAAQSFFDDGSHGDASPHDLTFSFQATVGSITTSGLKNLSVILSDAQSRTTSLVIPLTVESSLLAIHDIQGSKAISPHLGEVVTTSGIVTALKSNGFFIQAPDTSVDDNPNTSEGIFVFTSTTPPPAAAIGNLVMVTGMVQEFVPPSDPNSPSFTQIGASPAVTFVSSGHPLPAAVTLTAEKMHSDGSIQPLQQLEGMRVRIDSLTVISPTQGFIDETNATAHSHGIFYGVITGIPRPMREPGIEVPDPLPAGSPCCVPRFDANPERLRIESGGQIGASMSEVTSGSLITHLTGVLDYGYRTCTILPDPSPLQTYPGFTSAVPVPVPESNEFTVSSLNMGRFYDSQDDPAINEPVLSVEAFNRRLNKVSAAIRDVMRSPDILGVEEVENLDTLQTLAEKINSDTINSGDPNPKYQAFLVEGNDSGGMDVGFLVKRSRVNVVEVTVQGRDATSLNPNTGQMDLLHDRPPLLLRGEVRSPGGALFPMTVLVNHLRSRKGIDDPVEGNRIRIKRRAQAEFLAHLIQARQLADPKEHIILLGDFNSFQFNDGYVDVLGTIQGTPAPFDQVVLSSPDFVNPDLINLINLLPPEERYSFVFNGNAQALDHILITPNLGQRMSHFHFARNNADFPESLRNDSKRPERISDHDMPVAYFTFPPQPPNLSITLTASPDRAQAGSTVSYTLTVMNNDLTPATSITVSDILPDSVVFVSCRTTGDGVCGGSGNEPKVTVPSLAGGTSVSIEIVAAINCSTPDGTSIINTAVLKSDSMDSSSPSNVATVTTWVFNPPPTIICPANIHAVTDLVGERSVIVNYPLPVVKGLCPVNLVTSPLSGSRFNLGITPVTAIATDITGRTALCRFSVDVAQKGLFFAHFVNGNNFTSTMTFSNPSTTQPVNGTVNFLNDQGQPLSISINGKQTAPTTLFSLPPLGSTSLTTDGKGDLQTGAVQVNASSAIVGVLYLNVSGLGMAGASESAPSLAFITAAERHANQGFNTGIAIHNPSSSTAQVTLSLRGLNGREVTGGSRTEKLAAGGHFAKFIHELFPNADTMNFQGTLVITAMSANKSDFAMDSSMVRIVATAMQTGSSPGEITTLPVVAIDPPPASYGSFFPQWINGSGSSSSLFLINPLSKTVRGEVDFFDDEGQPMSFAVNGHAAANHFSFSLPPKGGAVFTTGGEGNLRSGSARVSAHSSIASLLRLSVPRLGLTGASASTPLPGLLVPVSQSSSKGVRTSVAILATDSAVSFGLTLRNPNGEPLPKGQTRMALLAHGRIARFVEELFPQADLSEFEGSLVITPEGGTVAATAMRIGSKLGELTALPVAALR